MSRQLRIAAVALGVVAIWWILWKAVDFERAPASRGDRDGIDPRSETIASDSKGPIEDAKLVSDARETLGSPASAIPPLSEAEEPPPGPSLRLFGFITDERTHQPLGRVAPPRRLRMGRSNRALGRLGRICVRESQPRELGLVESFVQRTLQQSVDLVPEEPERRRSHS
jgi:hypothetical protein